MNLLIVLVCVLVSIAVISDHQIPVKSFKRCKSGCRKTTDNRIIGSRVGMVFPYMVSLRRNRDGMSFPYMASLRRNKKHDCGGSILNNRWIMTAAWCLRNMSMNNLAIAVGSIYRDDPRARVYTVLLYEKHKNYGNPHYAHDIGLIKVSTDIEFNAYTKPIIFYTEYIRGGVNLTAIGWGQYKFENEGYTDILKIMTFTSITHGECKKVTGWLVRIYPTTLCAIPNGIAPGHYWGDTGGPLVYKEKVAGIAAFFYDGSNATLPDGFTRVSSYVDWIWETINK